MKDGTIAGLVAASCFVLGVYAGWFLEEWRSSRRRRRARELMEMMARSIVVAQQPCDDPECEIHGTAQTINARRN